MKTNKLTYALQLQSKTPHTLILGLPGYGKDTFGEGYITKYIGDWKVFDINSESRGEGMYYRFKQDDNFMIQKLNYLSNDILKPQNYKNEIIMFLGNNLKKIKQLPSNIKVCVFNEKWITNEELKSFIAFNEAQIGLMDTIFELNNDKHITLTELYNYLIKASQTNSYERTKLKEMGGAHYLTINTLKRRCRSLLRSGIFHNNIFDMKDNYFEYLDLEKSAKNKEVITSYSRYLIDNPYTSYICMNVLLKKFIELIELREVDIPFLFYVRELFDFYYIKNPPAYLIGIQEYFDKILRKGRFLGKTKIMFVGNTQLPSDLPPHIFNVFNKYIAFRLPLSESKKLLNKATIIPQYLFALSRVEVGKCMIVVSGTFQYPVVIAPTLHKKAEPDFDVFEHLNKRYGIKDYSDSSFCQST